MKRVIIFDEEANKIDEWHLSSGVPSVGDTLDIGPTVEVVSRHWVYDVDDSSFIIQLKTKEIGH